MNWKRDCIAVIPCLNEARAIGTVVRETLVHVDRVIVVDDGSSDDTGKLATAAGAIVLRNNRPAGKGASLRTAWAHAQQLGAIWILMLDGDGQHAPADIPRFFNRAEETGAALVVGDRMHAAAGIPWVRRLVNRWMSERLSRAAGVPLPDSQCGFRLCRSDALQALALECDHYEIESEQLLASVRAGYRVDFVPITVIYRGERSKIHPLRDTLRWFQWLARWKRSSSAPKGSPESRNTR